VFPDETHGMGRSGGGNRGDGGAAGVAGRKREGERRTRPKNGGCTARNPSRLLLCARERAAEREGTEGGRLDLSVAMTDASSELPISDSRE